MSLRTYGRNNLKRTTAKHEWDAIVRDKGTREMPVDLEQDAAQNETICIELPLGMDDSARKMSPTTKSKKEMIIQDENKMNSSMNGIKKPSKDPLKSNTKPDMDIKDITSSVKNISIKETLSKQNQTLKSPQRAQALQMQFGKALEKMLVFLDQPKVYDFKRILKYCTQLKKIGEATFSEVYSIKEFSIKKRQNLVMKVIPFGHDPTILVNGFQQQPIQDIFQEIYITSKLNKLSKPPMNFHFVEFVQAAICHGPYPDELLQVWDDYEDVNGSENDRPDYFTRDQHFAIVLLADAGIDLEHTKLKSWLQVESILAQLILSLGAAEQKYQFEHRDLHWGNVLVKETISDVKQYSLNSKNHALVELHGIEASIIDFTLSRMTSDRSGQVHYVPLADESFFTGEGDYQFEIYRKMKELVKDDWKSFEAKTNVYWLHYIVDKFLSAKIAPYPRSKEDKKRQEALKEFGKRMLNYPNAQRLAADPYVRSKIRLYTD